MDKNQNRKIPLKRAEYIKNEQRLLLSQGALLLALTVVIIVSSAFWTAITILSYNDIPPIFLVLLIGIAVALWSYSGYMAYIAITTNLPLFCLLTGKYTIEVDRVQRIELRSEKNRTYYRSLIGKLSKPDYITYQYVVFAKFGTYKTDPQQAFAQDQEFYVLVVPTKKPTILHLWACDEYELTER